MSSLDLNYILKSDFFNKTRKKFLDKSGISLALLDNDGVILSLASHLNKREYNVLIKKLIGNEHISTFFSQESIKLPEGIRFLVYKLSSGKTVKGYLIGGPVLLKGTSVEIMKNAGLTESQADFIPVLTSEKIEFAESFLENIVDFIDDYISEKKFSLDNKEKISTIYRMVKSLNSTLSLKEMLEGVLRSSVDLFRSENGKLLILDENSGNLKTFLTYCRKENKDSQAAFDKKTIDEVFETGKNRILNQALYIPLAIQERILGVLCIKGDCDFALLSQEEFELFEVIASSAAVAMNNAKLYESLYRKIQEHATLLFIANTISSSLNPETVLQEVLKKGIRLLDAKKGSLMMIDEETSMLRITNACGLSDDIITNTRIKLGEGISGRVAKTGEPLLIKKGVKLSESQSSKSQHELHSAVSVPVKIKEKVIGVLNINDHIKNEDFTTEHIGLLQMLSTQAAIAIENSRLHKELKGLFVDSVEALINAIEARDPYTKGHSIRVTHYTMKIAAALGMSPEKLENLQYAALLHDIGKINIRDDILLKPGKLTSEERLAIQEHPGYGASIMKPVKAFHRILPALYYHHEKYEGSGYPHKLKGKSIPIESRIIAVADSYDAMTSDRPYRKALEVQDAINELRNNSGTQFDPEIVEIFIKLLETDKTCTPDFVPDSPFI